MIPKFIDLVLRAEKASTLGRKHSRIMLRDALASVSAAVSERSDGPLRDYAAKYDDELRRGLTSRAAPDRIPESTTKEAAPMFKLIIPTTDEDARRAFPPEAPNDTEDVTALDEVTPAMLRTIAELGEAAPGAVVTACRGEGSKPFLMVDGSDQVREKYGEGAIFAITEDGHLGRWTGDERFGSVAEMLA